MIVKFPKQLRTFPRNAYPESDGKPMAETDQHRDVMVQLIAMLKMWYEQESHVYVSGDLLLFYEEGNKRRHLAPDVFVVHGVEDGFRPNYLMWEEGKGPDVVFEITSKSTRSEDTKRKFALYQDVLQVKEYYLFDPEEDYLDPPFQGYRLRAGKYQQIRFKDGRLPSQQLKLHIERDGKYLRLWNPETGQWIPMEKELLKDAREELNVERDRTDLERERAEAERERAETERERAEVAEKEVARLWQLIAAKANSHKNVNGNGAKPDA